MAIIDDAAKIIRTRLDEMNEEREKLERALTELGGKSSPRRPGRPPGRRKPGPKPGRRAASKAAGKPGPRKASASRVPRAEREQAILAFLTSNPKASAKEIAVAVDTTGNYVNNMLTGLRKQGRLVRKADGSQVEVKAGESSSAAAKPATAKLASRKKPGRPKGSKKRGAKKAAANAAAGK